MAFLDFVGYLSPQNWFFFSISLSSFLSIVTRRKLIFFFFWGGLGTSSPLSFLKKKVNRNAKRGKNGGRQ